MAKIKYYNIMHLFLLLVVFPLCFQSAGVASVLPACQESQPDSTITSDLTPDTTITDTVSIDTTRTQKAQPDTTTVSTVPTDTTVAPKVPVDTVRIEVPPPDTSRISCIPSDTAVAPKDTTRVPTIPPDTAAIDMAQPDTAGVQPAEVDTAAISPADTMFGKVYVTYVGEAMFTTKRTSPFSASYTYRYAGLESDTTLGVELITKIMQRTYRSHFRFPIEHADSVSIGPYDVKINSVDSMRVVFELMGYTQLPEPEIPEPVEEVAEVVPSSETGIVSQIQSRIGGPPKSSKEFFSRGYIRANAGNYDEAKKDVMAALEMDSTYFEAILLLGWILLKENKEKAVEVLRQCHELKPDDVTASFFLAYSLEKLGSSDEALDAYSNIVEADSVNSRSFFRMASLYEAKGDSQKADEVLEKARGFKPDIDSIAVAPSLSDIPHEYWWADEMPQLTHYDEPVYPDSAKADSLECEVLLFVLVNEQGNPDTVIVNEPCGDVGFNEAAEAAAWKCTFKPGTANGKPVSVWVSVPFRFQLEEEEEELVVSEGAFDSTATELDSVTMGMIPPDTGEVTPHLIQSVQPEYPQSAIKDSIETTVFLNVLVGTDGSVTEVKFTQPDTLMEAFNEAAEAAARQCRFRPGMRNGIPDTMWVELPLTFSLTSTPPPSPIPPGAREDTHAGNERRPPSIRPGVQDKAAAYVQATMLAQQGKYDEALDIVRESLESEPRDQNSQLLYGLITLARETGKRMDEVSSFTQGSGSDVYWWVDTMPQIKEFYEATYPDEAKETGAEGTVLLYVLVDEKGSVQRVSIVNPLEEASLNTAAEEAAKKCTFIPGTLHENPAKVWIRLPYEFTSSKSSN